MAGERVSRVVMVEDDPADRELLSMAIGRSTSTVVLEALDDGQEAIEWVRDRCDRPDGLPDLIISDLSMPRVTGLEMIERIRSMHPCGRIPIVVLTNSGSETDVSRAFDAGANGYVVKADDLTDLLSQVDSILRYWLDPGVRLTG